MFTNLIVRHPYIILTAVTVFCGTCLILPFTLKRIPDFSDPQLGFETRGTVIAQRLTAWTNLQQATKPFGRFAVDPRDILIPTSTTSQYYKVKKKDKRKKVKKNYRDPSPEVFIVAKQNNFSDDVVKLNQWKTLQELKNSDNFRNYEHNHAHTSKDGYFCGTPDQRYARVVLAAVDSSDLFNYKSMQAMCYIEHQLIQAKHFSELCEMVTKKHCCHPWSIANYVALLHNRTSCLGITEQDVNATFTLLHTCSQYYHNLQLTHDCSGSDYCQIPSECTEHNAVYNVLHYLTDIQFMAPEENGTRLTLTSATHLTQSTVFLPIACSTKTIDYYYDIEHKTLSHDGVHLVAMEFGLKNALFDEYLIRDTWLIGAGGMCVLFCMWLYTESLFLTIMTIIAVVFSLGISYFMYTLVFELQFFPFMNLLATIVVVGIGADDVFIFCKVWYTHKIEKNSSILRLMTETFHHAIMSMFVTSLTTAAAFYSSLISSITAVCCFSVFAGTAVIANFILMLTWLPASVVIYERWCWSSLITPPWKAWENKFRMVRITIDRTWAFMEKCLVMLALKYRYLWLVVLSTIAIISIFIVLKYPGLQLPNSADFQLFQSTHPFEQYDLNYKQKFWYERLQKVDSSISENYKLPLRFVWGVLPEDNGNFMDPHSKGTLQLDPTFDMADPKSQEWLLNFCRQLRTQPFYLSTLGPLLPNCFIESFLSWMQRRCLDPIDNIDRSPCCEIQNFPYERNIFQLCIIQAMSALYETPSEYFMPGVAGPKFSRDFPIPTIQAVVVEYDSIYSFSMSYNYMDRFYLQVENWTQQQFKDAPGGMKNGWFISELEFYDLQKVLSGGTIVSIATAMGIAFLVLLLVTLNILISVYAILSITFSIFTTMAILVLLGWKLNVLESIAVSTAIGLAVDFSLHYGISYKLCRDNTDRRACARQALSSMGGSTAMAALTTGLAGALMLPSSVLAYIQIGLFLVVVMSVSWVYSTFLFGSMLSIAGPQREFGQFRYPFSRNCKGPCRRPVNIQSENRQELDGEVDNTQNRHKSNVLSEMSNTNTVYAMASSESHELDSLTGKNIIHGVRQIGSRTDHASETHRYITSDHSPSATSDITIIMAEDN